MKPQIEEGEKRVAAQLGADVFIRSPYAEAATRN
jgi:hypothetical protein